MAFVNVNREILRQLRHFSGSNAALSSQTGQCWRSEFVKLGRNFCAVPDVTVQEPPPVAQSTQPPPSTGQKSNIMYVGANSTLGRTVGYLLGRLEEQNRAYIKCTGGRPVYHAWKTIVTAKRRVAMDDFGGPGSPELGLYYRVAHQNDADPNKSSALVYAVDMHKVGEEPWGGEGDKPEEVIQVKSTEVKKNLSALVLMAVANNHTPRLTGMGARCAMLMAAAHAMARTTVKNQGFDLVCVPEFREIQLENEETRTTVNCVMHKVAYSEEGDFVSTVLAADPPPPRSDAAPTETLEKE